MVSHGIVWHRMVRQCQGGLTWHPFASWYDTVQTPPLPRRLMAGIPRRSGHLPRFCISGFSGSGCCTWQGGSRGVHLAGAQDGPTLTPTLTLTPPGCGASKVNTQWPRVDCGLNWVGAIPGMRGSKGATYGSMVLNRCFMVIVHRPVWGQYGGLE